MNSELINFYDNCEFGVAVYKRLNKKNFEFVYYNPWGRKIDGINKDEKVIGRKLHDVFPNIFDFGLVDVLEKVYETGNTIILPNKTYVVDQDNLLHRTNRVQKLSNNLLVALYTDQEDIIDHLMKIDEERKLLCTALDYISHNLRGDVSTSLGVFELFDTVEIPNQEKESLLQVVKQNLENIDTKIHSLVRLLSKE
ncbi:hypothetical protein [Flammeovirga sp. SJP92]|uniref:hypothetical protein n=1 Tax=Flammeovirga sp. SJP92 TaxID=1775430 RepID=UPI000788BF66|nr:hypothetical protein [Flammeovirga sp. SJP92]KXX67377.1 hypothetical protein AVL50_27150 [Flammeovirga sp. SJP92]